MPSADIFRLDSGTSTCPAGSWPKWSGTQDGNKSVCAALAAAIVSGNKVTLLINDGDKTGTGQFFYLQN